MINSSRVPNLNHVPSTATIPGVQQSSEFLHSRLNLLDDQITINYDLSQPTFQINNEESQEGNGQKPSKKRKMSKKEKLAQENNYTVLPQAQLDKEIDFENDIDLAKTMWLVLRSKKSCNNILKKFETKDQLHYLKVNDIVKFGRVNFKLSIIKSDKLARDIQGGYDLLDKKNQEIQDQLHKLQELKTQAQSYRQMPENKKDAKSRLKNIGDTFGRGDLEEDLRQARHPGAGRNNVGLVSTQDQVARQQSLQENEASPYDMPSDLQPQLHRDPTRNTFARDAQNITAMGDQMQTSVNPDAQAAYANNITNNIDQTRLGETDQTRDNLGGSNLQHRERDESPARSRLPNNDIENEDFDAQSLPMQESVDQMEFKKMKTGPVEQWTASKQKQSSDKSSSYATSNAAHQNMQDAVCRICLGTESEGTPAEDGQPDKLICPCKCAGSMGMIHISCLREWVNSKRLVYKGTKVQSFFWKSLECELCQEAFENRMKYRMFQIMKFDLPNNENEYMIFESIKSAPAKVIHVFDLSKCDDTSKETDEEFEQKNEFRVGRSVETDMKIADISVSRVHSYIRVAGDKLILQDNGSKFGSLVKINRPMQLLNIKDKDGVEFKQRYKYNSNIIQVGRTMLYFKFYDLQSQLMSKETVRSEFPTNLEFDANDPNMSYITMKGTTFRRKTMLKNALELIPREYAPNNMIVDNLSMPRCKIDLDTPSSGSEQSSNDSIMNSVDVSKAQNKNEVNTVRNSVDNMLGAIDKSEKQKQDRKIFIQDQIQKRQGAQLSRNALNQNQVNTSQINNLNQDAYKDVIRDLPMSQSKNQARSIEETKGYKSPLQNNRMINKDENVVDSASRDFRSQNNVVEAVQNLEVKQRLQKLNQDSSDEEDSDAQQQVHDEADQQQSNNMLQAAGLNVMAIQQQQFEQEEQKHPESAQESHTSNFNESGHQIESLDNYNSMEFENNNQQQDKGKSPGPQGINRISQQIQQNDYDSKGPDSIQSNNM